MLHLPVLPGARRRLPRRLLLPQGHPGPAPPLRPPAGVYASVTCQRTRRRVHMRVNRLGVYVSTDSAAGVYASSVIRVNGLGRGRAPVSISEGLPTAAIAAPEAERVACVGWWHLRAAAATPRRHSRHMFDECLRVGATRGRRVPTRADLADTCFRVVKCRSHARAAAVASKTR